jgi:penicillin-binding protein 1A
MYEEGYITREQFNLFRDEEIVVRFEETSQKYMSSIAPYFVEDVRLQMEDRSKDLGINIYEDGLRISTTLDTRMMKIANRVVTNHLDYFQNQFDEKWDWQKNRETLDDLIDKAIKSRSNYMAAQTIAAKDSIYDMLKNNVAFVDSVQHIGQRIEVGFVVMDVHTGEIKVMVGGRDTQKGTGLNHVTSIKRQPGSAFKPIIYTIAIDNGLYPAYPILNQPFDYDGWQPTNFVESNVGGFVTLREAIQESINLVAARLIIEDHVKLWQVADYAKRMGIKSRLVLYPSIALGASEVKPIEITSAFGTLANKGIYNEPMSVLSIEDKDGILLESFTPHSREAISEETAYIITNMLESVVKEGTGKRIWSIHKFARPCAGKTGTNGDYKDAWFVGFTPQLVGGVWVGFNDQRVSFTGAWGQGSRAATPIWAEFMKEVYDSLDFPLEYFEPPASGNVSTVNFCEESIYELGDPKLYSDDCNSEIYSDIIKTSDIPSPFKADRDTTIRYFGKYTVIDSTAHEAIEILN